jgi:hypothetical protein
LSAAARTLTLPSTARSTLRGAALAVHADATALPGTPIQATAEHRRTEVNRRAQALAI